ncbi:FprA family A-type flavoprotein [Zongyangia hominis]|uniref:FprA family A-type flavoprotein n=1 Tax=Zongyangia hominis TaxID=2763677 RepID=A0A926ECK5_9FIRM|nr:FprA family A-type flavoprotein [Zongyangia hominis]MBC8569646.1 FprA family A-type flavoprotein [Zongyangia hominis]
MATYKITDSIYSVGVLNPNMRIFDIVMATEYGTTYNSYVVKGGEKTALIDTCHKTYFRAYQDNINDVADIEKIDYIIMNHNEPDHSGVLSKLIELNPNLTVVASQAGALYLKNITNCPDMKVQVVKDGDEIDLGGKKLKFIIAPFLHWPDSMFTWCEDDKVLFSCDFFGCHYCEPYGFDVNVAYPKAYEIALRGYYDAIFAPFAPYVRKGMDKIRDLDPDFICTSHGPILTKGGNIEHVKEMYELWSRPAKKEGTTIPVFYCTAYGNTGILAEAIRDGILSVLPDAKVPVYDINDHKMDELAAQLNGSDAFAIGSPTLNRAAVPPVLQLLSHLDMINNQKKPCLVFGSYGWSGEAVPMLTTYLKALKFNVFGDGCRAVFVPSEEEIARAKAYGADFAKAL